VNRRRWLMYAASMAPIAGGSWALWRYGAADGLRNDCRASVASWAARHPVVDAAWDGIDSARVWDAHVHLVGMGDSDSGVYVNPEMTKPANPRLYAQFLFYLNAGCVHAAPGRVDETYVARLRNLLDGMRLGAKSMLFAFDMTVNELGEELRSETMFHVPNEYAARVTRQFPSVFEWVASVHPYRHDAIDRLRWAALHGARAVKWLPNAMLIDPSAARCDAFYATLVELGLPLITHAGAESAVHSPQGHAYGNPLRLRRALEAGVRVVIAHGASHGDYEDLDVGPNGPLVPSFDLFARLMDEPRYRQHVYGDLSAIFLRNRAANVIPTLLEREDWHPRLLYGSDYPLPGILPLVTLDSFVARGLLDVAVVPVLREIREHNPLLFAFVLMRQLRSRGQRFARSVFHTRDFFGRARGPSV
jgi:uncharacterized protein